MNEVLFVLWFFAPAGCANAAPVVANNILAVKKFNRPMDFGKTYRGKRIFGDHKTFRGLVAGVLTATMITALEMILYNFENIQNTVAGHIDYGSPVVLLMGAATGCGALVGDAVKSFFKRQIGIQPGKNWVPFDQVDFIMGSMLFSVPFVSLPLSTYVITFVVAALLHPLINVLGWALRLKSKPF